MTHKLFFFISLIPAVFASDDLINYITANAIVPAPANHSSLMMRCFDSNPLKSLYGDTREPSIVTANTIKITDKKEIVEVFSNEAIFFRRDRGSIKRTEYNATTSGLLHNLDSG